MTLLPNAETMPLSELAKHAQASWDSQRQYVAAASDFYAQLWGGKQPPEDLRDLVWLPAQFQWANGGEAVGLIPARYPGSQDSDDVRICMGRRTEWLDQGNDTFHGIGQRVLATDTADYSLLDVRSISLEPPPSDTSDS